VTIRVLVADDQAVVRQGVVLLLSTSADIEVAGEASDGLDALRLALDLKPDVALVDLRMPGLDGAQVTERIVGAGIGTGSSSSPPTPTTTRCCPRCGRAPSAT
jgi:DNA-binding NarL/FixJ family response regulator